MEPLYYQPKGDPLPHAITVEVIQEEGSGLVFMVSSDGEQIGEVDVEILGGESGFVTGVGPGEKINNGYLRPASFAIASCIRESHPLFRRLYDVEDNPITPGH
jgi:hypothetical protein